MTEGLRLTARLDPAHGLVHFDIENASEAPIRYVDYYVGYFEGLSLEARRDGAEAWTRLPWRPDEHRIWHGAGPSSRNEREVAPGARIPPPGWGPNVHQGRFDDQGRPHPGLDVPRFEEAFLVDLLDVTWPAAWGDLGRGRVEVRVTQHFPDWSEHEVETGWKGAVSSAPLLLDLEDLREPVRRAIPRL